MADIADDARAAVIALRAGRTAEAFAAVARASTAFNARKKDAVAAAPMDALLVGQAQLAHERFPAALHTFDRGLAVLKAPHQGALKAAFATNRAVALAAMLRLKRAAADLDTAAEIVGHAHADEHLLVIRVQQALVADLSGDIEALADAVAASRALLATLPDGPVAAARACRLAALMARRDPEACLVEVHQAVGPKLEGLDPTFAVQLMGVLVQACLDTGRRAEAEQWAARMARRAARCGLPVGRVRARAARGALLLGIGDGAGAAELCLRAAETATTLRSMADALHARIAAGRSLLVAGAEREAVAELSFVAEEAALLGAGRLREEAVGVLRDLGIQVYDPPASPEEIAARLEPGEYELMRLALTEDADKDLDLSSIFNKLGVRTRGELAAFVARLDYERRRQDAPTALAG